MKKTWYDMGKSFRDGTKDSIDLSTRHVVKSSNIRCSNLIDKQKIESLKEDYTNFVLVQWETTEGVNKKFLNSYNFDNSLDTEAFCSAIEGRIKASVLKKKFPKVFSIFEKAFRNRGSQIPEIKYSTSHRYRYTESMF
jgi:hypothetical protein